MIPLKVLVAHSYYRHRGGEDVYVDQQVELLAKHADVRLLAERNAEVGDVSAVPRAFLSLGRRSRIRSVFPQFSPDIVHMHNIYPALGPEVHRQATKHQIPLVMTVHNYRLRCPNGYMFTEGQVCTRCLTGSKGNALLHQCFPSRSQAAVYASSLWFHRRILALEDKIAMFVAPSEFVRKSLISWGFDSRRVTMIRNFTSFRQPPRVELGHHGVFVGRLSSEKGIDILLRALKLAHDPKFSIIGDGPLRDSLGELAQDLNLRRLRFLGRVSATDIQAMLRDARYVVVPSLSHENASLAAMEGLASALPLIVSDRGGLPELAAEGRGIVVPAGDAPSLAHAIQELIEDDDICARAGVRGRNFWMDELRPEVHVERLLTVYRELVGEHGVLA